MLPPIKATGSESTLSDNPVLDEAGKNFIKENLGPDAVPSEQPEDKKIPEPEAKMYAGKFKSDKDLENAYLEEEKKITQQGTALSSLKPFFETDEKGNLIMDEQGKPVPKVQPEKITEQDKTEKPQEDIDLNTLDTNNPEALKKFVQKLGLDPDKLQDEFYENPLGTLVKLSVKVSDMRTQKMDEFISGQQKEKELGQIKQIENKVKAEYEEISKNPFFKQYEKEILTVFDEIPELAIQPKAYEKAMKYYIANNLDKFADIIQEKGIQDFLEMGKNQIEKGNVDNDTEATVISDDIKSMAGKLGVPAEDVKKNLSKGGK